VDTIRTRALLTGVNVNTDLPDYPGGDPTRFWASGRFPFMMDIVTNIDGVEREISLINVHARSNGGGESSGNPRYAMRRYDVEVLYDSLEAYYSDKSIIMLGDYNDDVDETVADTGAATVPDSGESSFFKFLSDEDYRATTLPLSEAGMRSFIYNENVIDHITISNELFYDHIVGAERVVIPYSLIPDYNNTASDHFPVEARFKLMSDEVLAITEVSTLESIQVALGTPFSQLELPDNVQVTLEGGSTTLVAVNWSFEDYDANTLGPNTIEGVLSLQEGISNPDNLTAAIEVIVKPVAITALREFTPLEVAFGTSFEELSLPSSTFVTLENGDTTLLSINWSAAGYNASQANTYNLQGDLVLTEGIANPDILRPTI
ncbi:endonuclease, partial [Marivirga lumbricoides]